MSIFDGINISASGLTAQRLRMDVISSNLANADTTRASLVNGQWEPYRRKMVVMEPNGNHDFANLLQHATARQNNAGEGVKVSAIVDDPSPFKRVYQPDHPDADQNGYVRMPNVDPLKEMVDLLSTTRSYQANVTALNATKGMLMKALQIGR